MIFHEQVDSVLSAMSRVGIWVVLAAVAAGVVLLARRYLMRDRHAADLVDPSRGI